MQHPDCSTGGISALLSDALCYYKSSNIHDVIILYYILLYYVVLYYIVMCIYYKYIYYMPMDLTNNFTFSFHL